MTDAQRPRRPVWRVELSSAAARDLDAIRRPMFDRIREAIDALADDPRPRSAAKLSGAEQLWRIRVGDYRIVYQVNGKQLLLLVVKVGNRRDIHRR